MRLPAMEVLLRAIEVQALKGKVGSQKILMDLNLHAYSEREKNREKLLDLVINYKQFWESEFETAKRHKVSLPAPVPHPDHVLWDCEKHCIKFVGPTTQNAKKVWDRLHKQRDEIWSELKVCEDAWQEACDCANTQEMELNEIRIVQLEKKLDECVATLDKRWPDRPGRHDWEDG